MPNNRSEQSRIEQKKYRTLSAFHTYSPNTKEQGSSTNEESTRMYRHLGDVTSCSNGSISISYLVVGGESVYTFLFSCPVRTITSGKFQILELPSISGPIQDFVIQSDTNRGILTTIHILTSPSSGLEGSGYTDSVTLVADGRAFQGTFVYDHT